MTALWIIIGIIVIIGIFLWATYNSLVTLKVRVDEAWSDITVQLKRRLDLIPNLVNSVKGYAAHESGVFEKVTEARANALSAQGVKETAAAENQFEGALKSLFAVAEAYPDLKANQNMMQLSEELSSTENKVAFARQAYNDAVMTYNNRREMFPGSVVANMFQFQPAELLKIESDTKREAPKVSFT